MKLIYDLDEDPPAASITPVPNLFPTLAAPYRIAFIGEAPGKDEVLAGEPFVGASGRLLTSLAGQYNITRQACFLGNVCQHRPPGNKIEAFKWDGPEIQSGLAKLWADLAAFKPTLCILLGNTALRAFGIDGKITYWRGSVFRSVNGYKCLAAYHPASVLRQYEWLQVLALDLRRAAEEGKHDRIEVPERHLLLPEEGYADSLLIKLHHIAQTKSTVSIDIEGGVTGMSCLSIATSPQHSFIVPFTTTDGVSFWSEEYEDQLWDTLSCICSDPHITKIFQNGLYDLFVLAYAYKLTVLGPFEDTMLKHWEAYCELPKGLDFLASIYTKQPPWKDDRTTPDLKTFWRYCCTDSAVTYEINTKLDSELCDSPSSIEHYRFNLAMLYPILYMELRGIRYDKLRADTRCAELEEELKDLNDRLDIQAGKPINVNSPKFRDYLYDELQLPEQHNRKTGERTANYEALLTLAKKTDHPVLHLAIAIRSLRTRLSMLRIDNDQDGRIRCGYNIVGAKTGRITCYTSPTGSGYNLQTIPEYDRDLFLADQGYYLFQCDLSGADAWTVAAHCARLGDPTMLDDLRAGLAIAKVVAAMFIYGPEVSRLPREQLKKVSDEIEKKNPLVFGGKCCQHGTNYGMGKVLLSQTIFIQSEGKVNISAKDAERLQSLYMSRYYGVRMWHAWCQSELRTKGQCTSASGNTRIFFGRREEYDTLKEFLAHEPQNNTTYATNLAALRLWTDPDNRMASGALTIEPLHQVHDALVGQFPIETLERSLVSIRGYFNNPITIAGQTLVIPFKGEYGESWGNLNKGKI